MKCQTVQFNNKCFKNAIWAKELEERHIYWYVRFYDLTKWEPKVGPSIWPTSGDIFPWVFCIFINLASETLKLCSIYIFKDVFIENIEPLKTEMVLPSTAKCLQCIIKGSGFLRVSILYATHCTCMQPQVGLLHSILWVLGFRKLIHGNGDSVATATVENDKAFASNSGFSCLLSVFMKQANLFICK